MLFAIACKVVEPSLFAWQFNESSQAENVDVYDAQTREVKIYHPLPYHNATEVEKEVSSLYQEGDKFYNVVEQRFQNDTFYIKIQDNLSARERFFALGNAVKDLKSTSKDENKTPSKSTFSLEDFSKFYFPSTAPAIERGAKIHIVYIKSLPENYLFHYLSPSLSTPTPPPNC
jgi:hypothetical protein